jgi:hypothetical protein
MAKVSIKPPDDFTAKIGRLGSMTDYAIERALDAAGKVVLDAVRGNLSGAIGSNTAYDSQSTGELMGSLGVTPVGLDNSGVSNIKIGFNEPRRVQPKGEGKRGKNSKKKDTKRSYKTATNAMIANVLEYGRHGQPPRPFLKPAKSASKSAALAAMQAELEAVIDSL